jgi:8-oxo-dGTP diphosphatase
MKKDAIRHIHVACAIIERDGRVLAAQRKEGSTMALKWEFPGGKLEPGESPESCLRRELVEEMGIHVDIVHGIGPLTHRYPFFTVTLYPFVCTIFSGQIVMHEHAAISWLAPEELFSLDWAEADIPVIESYLLLRESRHR